MGKKTIVGKRKLKFKLLINVSPKNKYITIKNKIPLVFVLKLGGIVFLRNQVHKLFTQFHEKKTIFGERKLKFKLLINVTPKNK
jgi:hypothetical protein